jgi:hypothetical protein
MTKLQEPFLLLFETCLIINVRYCTWEGTARRATVSLSTEGTVSRHVILLNCKICTMWRTTQALTRRFLTPKCQPVSCYTYNIRAWMQVSFMPIRNVGPPLRRIPRHSKTFHSATCRYPVRTAADSESRRVNYGQKCIYARQKSMSLTKPLWTKLTLDLCFGKNRYTKFHGNPTNGLLAETWLRTDRQTGGWKECPHVGFIFYFVKKA